MGSSQSRAIPEGRAQSQNDKFEPPMLSRRASVKSTTGSVTSQSASALAYAGLKSVLSTNALPKSFNLITFSNKTLCETAAASLAVPPPPLPTAPPAPPGPAGTTGASTAPTDTDDAIAKAARAVSSYVNPGPYEQAATDAKRLVMLDTFDGFRCDINKQVSPFMGVFHSFWLGTSMIQTDASRRIHL
jgi:hypothetical protein